MPRLKASKKTSAQPPETAGDFGHPFCDPKTPDEWQLAVDAAEMLLLIDSARLYGLITGGPRAKVKRCEEILRIGREHGFTPGPASKILDTVL
jgi:hypothetical protein